MMRSGHGGRVMGVAPGEPNPVPDFVRLYLSTGVWKLVSWALLTRRCAMTDSRTANRVLR